MRTHVVVLHPELPLVLAGEGADQGALLVPGDDGLPTWPQMLAAVRALAPAGVWPLGPDRSAPDLRVHVVQAKNEMPGPGYHWAGAADLRWPEPLSMATSLSSPSILDRSRSTQCKS